MTDIIGYMATAFGTFLMLPQLVKMIKTRSVKDISWLMVCLYVGNCLLWFIYGYLKDIYPVMLSGVIAGIIACFQFYYKVVFSR